MKKYLFICLFACFNSAIASPVLFNNDKAGFDAATSSLTFEGFESATMNSPTEIGFSGGTFSCNGSRFCPGFFGINTFPFSGSTSVFFSTPDTAVFSFNDAINSFGIIMGGQGNIEINNVPTPSPIDLFITNSLGNTFQVLDNFVGPNVNQPGGFNYFLGFVDTMSTFTSITISASNSGDGIFFDNLEFGISNPSPVPIPAAVWLFASGFIGLIGRRKFNSSRTSV